ncbi:MAG: hypothetical protein AAB295_02300, partial [Chloroflexota bacterium]
THHARRALQRTLEHFRASGDRRGQSRVLLLLSRVARVLAEPATELVEEARKVVEDLGDTPELARALITLGNDLAPAGRITQLREIAEPALAMAERLNDKHLIAGALSLKAAALVDDDPAEAVRLALRSRDLALEAGVVMRAVMSYFTVVFAMERADASPAQVVRMIDDGLAYARRHGVENNALIPAAAYYHLNRGDWDSALAAAQQITKSEYLDNALEIRGRIAEGRDGPAAASALYAEQADAWRRLAGAASIPAHQAAAYAALLRADDAAARAALAELRPSSADQVLFVTDTRLLISTALLAEREDLERYEVASRGREAKLWIPYALAWSAARAFADGDAAACGRILSSVAELLRVYWPYGLDTAYAEVTLAFARATLRSGGTLGPEWDSALAGARAFAERAKAAWWLAELDTLRAR